MRLITKPVVSNDPLGPSIVFYSQLAAVQALAPNILIDTTQVNSAGGPAYILNGLAGTPTRAFKLLNLADETSFVPVGTQHPNMTAYGAPLGNMLRFGFGGALTNNIGNGVLGQEQQAQVNMSGSYTAAFLARRPTATELGGGSAGAGPVIGSQSGSPFAGIFMAYAAQGVNVYHNGTSVSSYLSGETIGTFIDFIVVFNASAQTVQIYENGTLVGTTTGVTTPWTASNVLQIGAAGLSSYWAQLDIAVVAVWGGTAFASGSAAITAINYWLAATKARVT